MSYIGVRTGNSAVVKIGTGQNAQEFRIRNKGLVNFNEVNPDLIMQGLGTALLREETKKHKYKVQLGDKTFWTQPVNKATLATAFFLPDTLYILFVGSFLEGNLVGINLSMPLTFFGKRNLNGLIKFAKNEIILKLIDFDKVIDKKFLINLSPMGLL